MHDVVIRNGTVVDGRGGRPVVADVAIDDGLITEVGAVADPGREELDATRLAVTPGFVDVHTHYDGQVTWDPLLTPSIWHGVTTVVMGNCGVGFAPAAPDRHDWLIGLMEGVEGIPGASLREAIRWDWESVAEYLDALDQIPRALDVAAQVPHGAVRAFVMGERGAANEPATDDDIARMAALVTEGVAAGAVGVSVNRLELHKAVDGREVPGTFAAEEEIVALVHAARAGSPDAVFTTILPGAAGETRDAWDKEVDWLSRVSREAGLAVTFPFGGARGEWRSRLDRIERENEAGARIVPQVSSHGQGLFCGLRTSHAFRGRPTYDAIEHLPVAERAARMAEPDVRAAIVAERPPPGVPRLRDLMLGQATAVFPWRPVPDYEPDPASSLAAQSAVLGCDPEELLYDWTIADGGDALVHFFLGGYPGNLDVSAQLLVHPASVLGLGDGGAHVDLICDAGYPSFVLSYWVRERPRGTLALETAVKILTSEPAAMYGLRDRGVVAPGYKADLNVIDPVAIEPLPIEVVHDLPAGAKRVLQRTEGFVATIVNGEIVQRGGVDTGARPGRVVRSGSAG
ncbi:MAG: N-acyl-D-amino-acid deacylase [Actinomycetota bacterium]|nr:N-acyl-D-amino-acid deacylase [Actinomycetota bacterium]